VFQNCTSLTSIVISDSVISIGDNAFADCTNLINVYISDSNGLELTSPSNDTVSFYGSEVYLIPPTLSILKAEGYTATEMKVAGFTATEMKQAGYTATELKEAGFTATELKEAGFTATEMKEAGFTATELKEAGFTATEMKVAGFTATELEEAGFTATELKEAGFTATELKQAGFTASELEEAGFTASELEEAGFTATELEEAGFTKEQFPCFKEDTKILTIQGYKLIQDLRKGDLVKTLKHDYKPIDMIGKREIYHPASKERIKDQLYKCSQENYPEIFEPLIITGCHSILVDNFTSEEQKQKVIEVNGNTYVTDNKYRLPACADPRASVYETVGIYTIYHLALENDDYYMNYGVYANGLLVETCSKRYLKELSNMTLIE
jgi:uncharacterized protein YjbI with pentapeptide repeats